MCVNMLLARWGTGLIDSFNLHFTLLISFNKKHKQIQINIYLYQWRTKDFFFSVCVLFCWFLFLTKIEGGGFHKKITHIPKIEGGVNPCPPPPLPPPPPLRTHLTFMIIYLLKIIYSLDPMVTKPYLN